MWHSLKIETVVHETDKATLVRIPNTGLMFWHPKKLIKVVASKNYLKFNSEFTFDLFEMNKVSYNKKESVISKTISASELIVLFN